MTRDLPWRDAHRVRLHHFANNASQDMTTIMVPDFATQTEDRHGEPLLGFRPEEVSTTEMADFFFDMKLAGEPLQCSEEDGTCADMS